jgi:uncharacterized Zn finger protein
MKPPREVVVECPACGAETAHEILGGRVVGKKKLVLKSSVRCCECGHVHAVELAEEMPVKVPIVISWLEESSRSFIPLAPSEEIKVGDELYHDDHRVIVTSLEVAGGRKEVAKAKDIGTIWGKRFDKVWVKISLDRHGKVYSKEILAVPEEEFEVGDIIEIEGNSAAITSIRLEGRTIHKGFAPAREIVRVYSKGIRRPSTADVKFKIS